MDTSWVYSSLLALYVCILVVIAVYGVHRYQLVYLYYKHRRNAPRQLACFRNLPGLGERRCSSSILHKKT